MAQKMLIILFTVLVLGFLLRELMKGPDLRIYLQSPTEISQYWSVVVENPGPKTAENITVSWKERQVSGQVLESSFSIDSLSAGETVFKNTTIREGTVEVFLECCENFKLKDTVEVAAGSNPPYPILNHNPLVHPIYSFYRFTGFLEISKD